MELMARPGVWGKDRDGEIVSGFGGDDGVICTFHRDAFGDWLRVGSYIGHWKKMVSGAGVQGPMGRAGGRRAGGRWVVIKYFVGVIEIVRIRWFHRFEGS